MATRQPSFADPRVNVQSNDTPPGSGDASALLELEAAFRRLAERMTALGDADDEATQKQRGQLYLEAAGYFGYMALVTMPEARNYVVCTLRFDGAEDPFHSAISFEARWQAGKTPDETIAELKRHNLRLETEWREMKAERDEARLRSEGSRP